jgi:hypothetical protein
MSLHLHSDSGIVKWKTGQSGQTRRFLRRLANKATHRLLTFATSKLNAGSNSLQRDLLHAQIDAVATQKAATTEAVKQFETNALFDDRRVFGCAGNVRHGLFSQVGVVGAQMAIRIARGLFRLWVVGSIFWIAAVGVLTWRQFVFFEPVAVDNPSLQSTADICSNATTSDQCYKLLEAAGKNPFYAFLLNWTDKGWSFPDNTAMEPKGIAWERLPVALLWAHLCFCS